MEGPVDVTESPVVYQQDLEDVEEQFIWKS